MSSQLRAIGHPRRARDRARRVLAVAAAASTALVLVTTGLRSADAAPGPPPRDDARSVMFVGDNHDGTITVIDARTFEVLHTIDNIPDHAERMAAIAADPVRLGFFLGVRTLIGQGNDQFTDDVFSAHDGRTVYVSRPSFADVVAIDLATGAITWRYPVDGYRSDHMAISPDGTRLLVSDSTANIVHEIDTATGERTGTFPSGDSPHESEYLRGGTQVLHAAIGRVYTPVDRSELDPVTGIAKGEELLQLVDADTLEIIQRWDIEAALAAYGRDDMRGAVRPMAIHPDERTVYFQVSFHHGYVEFDLEAGEVVDVVELPISETAAATPREQYLLDSAHHGLAIDPAGDTLCVAGTMSDYAALVDVATGAPTIVSSGTKPYWSTTGPTGDHCWVSYSGDDEVAVVDYATGTELARVDVGDHPQRVRAGLVAEDLLGEGTGGDLDPDPDRGPDPDPTASPGPTTDVAADPAGAAGPGGATGAATRAPLPVTGAPAGIVAAGLLWLAVAALRRRDG